MDIPASLVSRYIDANGYMRVRILVQGSTGTSTIYVDQIYITLGYTVDTAHTEAHEIVDTAGGLGTLNELRIADNIVGDGVVDWWRYSICQLLTHHVAEVVTTYDELFTLDAATDVVASTNYVGRHFHRMTPLAILREMAKIDGTDFWLDADYDLHWNDAYSVAGAPTWSDPGGGGTYEVLYWEPAPVRLKDVINECFIEGYTSGSTKIQDDYSDAASIASYGQRSEYVNNADICRNDECLTEATNRVKRRKDPPIHVSAILNGYNTRSLGEVVIVHSDKLNIQSVNYVITRKVYDSRDATTTYDLVPRPGASPYQVNARVPLGQLMQRVEERITALEQRGERGIRYTEVWT
jgi:hypothetical protein